jgi:hypothetical protein
VKDSPESLVTRSKPSHHERWIESGDATVRARIAKLAALSVLIASIGFALFLPSHLCYTTGRLLIFQVGRCDDVDPLASLPEDTNLVDAHIDRQIGLRLVIVGVGVLISILILLLALPESERRRTKEPR